MPAGAATTLSESIVVRRVYEPSAFTAVTSVDVPSIRPTDPSTVRGPPSPPLVDIEMFAPPAACCPTAVDPGSGADAAAAPTSRGGGAATAAGPSPLIADRATSAAPKVTTSERTLAGRCRRAPELEVKRVANVVFLSRADQPR